MLEAVGSYGYQTVTIGVVLGRTGTSTRAFDLEFEGKEDCYLAALDFGVEKVESLIREEARGETTWLGRFASVFAPCWSSSTRSPISGGR